MIKIPPPVIGLLCALAMWLLAKYLPLATIALPGQSTLAIVVAVIAITIDVTALWSFRKAKTTINPLTPHKSSAVVSTGVYRYSRNPMYVGMLFLLIAWGIYLGAISAWILPPLFVWIITTNQILPEERALAQLFGQNYLAYKNSVRRWL